MEAAAAGVVRHAALNEVGVEVVNFEGERMHVAGQFDGDVIFFANRFDTCAHARDISQTRVPGVRYADDFSRKTFLQCFHIHHMDSFQMCYFATRHRGRCYPIWILNTTMRINACQIFASVCTDSEGSAGLSNKGFAIVESSNPIKALRVRWRAVRVSVEPFSMFVNNN